jgi:hypothetical protein
MKTLYLSLLFWIFAFSLQAQQNFPSQSYQLVTSENKVQYKNYYLLTLMQQLPEVKKALMNDPILQNLLKEKTTQANGASTMCKLASCYAAALKFNETEISKVGERLIFLYQTDPIFSNLVKADLLPSGCYGMFADLPPAQLLVKAWEEDAKAVNYAIDVYVMGKQPNYPKIDSISFVSKDKQFAELIAMNAALAFDKKPIFFEPTLKFALGALEINGRNEAADYEPMATGINQAAIAHVKKTKWGDYKYSVILVPGAGPDDRETALSAGGMIRCRLAAVEYQKGLAPFIVVSGGRVHPYKTKFSEAYEMKKFMVEVLKIPAQAILIEPHARHTTTNLRNCIRLMFRYGMPMDKPAIVCNVPSASTYIGNLLLERCKKEFGYYPYKNGLRLSDTVTEFYPDAIALQLDDDEPLDP